MEKIASFTIDHLKLLPGIYVSRKDQFAGNTITTIDIRMTRPNFEPVMNTAEMHSIEHLGATFLRNHKEFGPSIIYFGPMGCRTGCYLVLAGDFDSRDILPVITDMFRFIVDFEGVVPGNTAIECGNYQDTNLSMAKYVSCRYLAQTLEQIEEKNLVYPE